MSTHLYLECLDHNPPIRAPQESGQNTNDLPQIRSDIKRRDMLRDLLEDGWTVADRFRMNTARFLANHPRCRIGIRDEYGGEYPLDEDEPA